MTSAERKAYDQGYAEGLSQAVLPSHEIMKRMSQVALEQATLMFARRAREFARTLPKDATGSMALEAFARAIESSNEKVWPTQGERKS